MSPRPRRRRSWLALVSAALTVVGCGAIHFASDPSATVVLRGVTLIDGTGAPPRDDVTLVIEGRRITEVGSADVELAQGSQVLDAAGIWAIPGLWDMHVHLSKAKEEALPVLVAAGVTSVRDMGGDLEELRGWQAAVSRHELVGPRVVLAGPSLEAPETIERLRNDPTHERWQVTRVVVPDVASADRIVGAIAAQGVDFIKIRETVSLDVYAAVVRAAHRHGLPVAGHAPYGMDPIAAAALGVVSFEHASYPYPLDSDPAARARILEAFVAHHVVIVPTLVAWQTHLMDRDQELSVIRDEKGLLDPRRRLISDFLADEWRFDVEAQTRKSSPELRGWQAFFDRQADDLRAMHEAGIPMLPGSDLAGPLIYPGYSLHDELENLVRLVGLTPMEAIESATRQSAELAGRSDDLGTLEPGKLADLVLLKADPLVDIANTREIVGVFADGRYLDAAAIHRLLSGLSLQAGPSIDLAQVPEESGSPQ